MFAAAFFWLYAGSITELAARYRTSGGSFDFVKAVLGRRAAALMAILGLLKLILANSALALAISSYLGHGGMPRNMQLFCWISTYSVFTMLDIIGVRQSANIQVMATLLCISILVFYSASSLTMFSDTEIRRSGLFNDGLLGYFKGFPFALQFFDGFEEVPLLMGYAINPEKTIPQAITSCYITVLAIAVMILISGSGITPFSLLIQSEAPLMNGIEAVYGESTYISDTVANLIVLGLLVNFFAFVLFASQQMQAVAEAGQLPAFLAYRHPVHGAPINASICSSIVGLILTVGFAFAFGESAAQDTLVTAALMPAVLGYALLLECIVEVRRIEIRNFSGHTKPHDTGRLGADPGNMRFYYGLVGAKVAQLMCLMFIIGLLVLAYISDNFRWGLILLAFLGGSLFVGMMKFMGEKTLPGVIEGSYGDHGAYTTIQSADSDRDDDLIHLLSDTSCYAEEYNETDTEDADYTKSPLNVYHC